jgi:hypothetical protein
VPVPDADQARAPLPISGNVPDAREPPSAAASADRCSARLRPMRDGDTHAAPDWPMAIAIGVPSKPD